MGTKRVPVWRGTERRARFYTKEDWERSKPWLTGILFVFALVFFGMRVRPWRYDAFLVWLKLLAFFTTAVLGMVGVIKDFRDRETGKITGAGKWNIASLILAALVGMIAQYKEYTNAEQASADAKAAPSQY